MIDEVMICGVRRANSLVPVGEIQQAIGRAGRGYGSTAKAVILCPAEDAEYASSCLVEQPPPVRSQMSSVEEVAFHVLPWMDRVYDDESFGKWKSRSLSEIQGSAVRWCDVERALLESGCIDEEHNLTRFGRISVRMYYRPDKMLVMKDKLREVFDCSDEIDPITLSYVLSFDRVPLADVEAWELSEYKGSVSGRGYYFTRGELIQAFAFYCIMVNESPKWMRHVINGVRDDLSRSFGTLEQIADCFGMGDFPKRIRVAGISAMRRVTYEIAGIIDEFGLASRNSALELKDMGIFTRSDLSGNENDIIDNGSDGLKAELSRLGFLPDLAAREMRRSEGTLKET